MGSYYPVHYKLGCEGYIIWYTNETDRFYTMFGKVPSFGSMEELLNFVRQQNISLIDEVQVYDLNGIARWCDLPKADDIDCNEMLNCLNLFIDLFASLEMSEKGLVGEEQEDFDLIYGKLFHGTNSPAVFHDCPIYTPDWSPAEVEVLVKVLVRGLKVFSEAVCDYRGVVGIAR